jgi:membrane protein
MPRWLRSLITTAKIAYDRWSADGGAFLAGSVAYFAAVAFFPLLLVILSMTGWFLRATQTGQDAESYVLQVIGEQLSPVLKTQVATVFDQVRNKASLGGPVGVITLLTVVIALFTQVDAAFDRIWKVKHPNTGWWDSIKRVLKVRLKAFVMLTALLIAIVIVFLSGMALSAAETFMGQRLPTPQGTSWALQVLVSFVLNATVFTLIYYWLPNAVVPFRAALRGGLLAGLVWEIGRQVLTAFVIGRRYESAYGVVGAFLAIMLWVYYAATVVFFGAEVTHMMSQQNEPAARESQ